MDNLVL